MMRRINALCAVLTLVLPHGDDPTVAAMRAEVGFHDGLERRIRPFAIYSASDSSADRFERRMHVPMTAYAHDKSTAARASPPDILSAEPRRQKSRLVCPVDRDLMNSEARSYDRRARESTRRNLPLHFQSKWKYFTLVEWLYYVQCMTAHFADTFEPGKTVFDSGSGAGAFVKALDVVYPGMEFYGTDLSAAQIEFANGHVYEDSFCVANSRNIHWVRDQFPGGFDYVISNGVMHLACEDSEQSYEYVQLMIDLAKPGGYVWLGTINDEDKRRDPNNQLCYGWDGGSGSLFYEKSWWLENLDSWGAFDLQIVNESDACGALYVGDRCRYTILMRKKEGPMPPPKARKDEALDFEVWKQRQLRKIDQIDRVVQLLERKEESWGLGSDDDGCWCRTTNYILGSLVFLLGLVVIKQKKGPARFFSTGLNGKGRSL